MGHDARIGVFCWCVGHVTTRNQSCLAPKVFHLHIKNEVTVDLLEAPRWNSFALVQDFECDPHILYLLLHSILPKPVAVLLIERNSLVPVPRDFDPKLMVPLVVPPVDCRNNAVPPS